MRTVLTLLFCAFTTHTAIAVSADAKLSLGDKQRVTDLYSFPNNCSTVCYRPWTLEQTAEHYLNTSLRRDGFTNTQASVYVDNGIYFAKLSGSVPTGFIQRYEQFLALGDTALTSARAFHGLGKWRYDWRFILPLGLPMLNNRTLEVMDFPPLTLLLETQDYLRSNTTNRWTTLLGENGVPMNEYDLYGAILDIVPVAAPAGDGKKLEESGIYDGSFDGYAIPLLALWTSGATPSDSKPIMALGAPIRTWFKRNFNLTLGVLDVKKVSLPDGRISPVMGTNHPSYFFYAANKYTNGPDKDEKNFALGMEVMKQDIVAACWQVEMGKAPSFDPVEMKEKCVSRWTGKDKSLCVLVEMQAYKKSEEDAKAACDSRIFTNQFIPSKQQLKEFENEFFEAQYR
jgi:hypothetical protein